MMPEPSSRDWPLSIWIFTTLGRTLAETSSTEPGAVTAVCWP